ncbi:MAG: lipoprotein, partial [Clostridia bacterium]|nr:lipoprotein [Clostridia bacterium]
MKKFISLLLAFVFVLALAGCQNNTETSSPSSGQNSQNAGKTNTTSAESSIDSVTETSDNTDTSGELHPSGGNKTLVVYFSRTGEQYTVGTIDKGNTAIVAEMIAEKTGADLYEILPETDYYPYTYKELTDVAKKEQNEKARPKIKGSLPDVSKY